MTRRIQVLTILVLILSISYVAGWGSDQYLYTNLENDGGRPIIDYNSNDDNPDFIYQEHFPYHRVVEFYSHRCPHCQRFAPHYIEFGRKFEDLTKQSSGHYAGLEVKFYAVSCYPHRNICKQENIKGYPTVKVYKAHSNEGMQLPYYELHPETLVKKLGIEAVQDNWKAEAATEAPQSTQPQQAQPLMEEKPAFLSRRSTEVFGDAYLSFHTVMKNSVFLDQSNQLSPEKEKTLKNWLILLQRVLPPWRIHPLLESLLGGPTKNFTASIATEDNWMGLLDQHPPRTTDYSPACQLHDSPYTCGLWTLFHIMTVGFVEFNSAIVNEDANKYVILNIHMVAQALRDFIQHFLLCDVCKNHFLQEYDSCFYDRCTRFPPKEYGTGELKDWKELVFWLLETHNGVNVRLQWERANGATISSEQQQTVMWPPVSDCPGCWLQPQGAKSAKLYNKTMMYNFLRSTYWPKDTDSSIAKEDVLRLQSSPAVTNGVNSNPYLRAGAPGETKTTSEEAPSSSPPGNPIVDAILNAVGASDPKLDSTAGTASEENLETSTAESAETATATEDNLEAGTSEEAQETATAKEEGDIGNINSLSAKLSVVSKEVQYSMILILVVVVVIWNKRRIRQKLATRTQ